MHIKAVEALRAVNGTSPMNLKFLVEGEEEIGGASIARYVAKNPAKLKADVALVSDTALYAEGLPTLCIGLRGPGLHGNRSHRPSARSAFRTVWRRCSEPGFRLDRAAIEMQRSAAATSGFPACTTT